MFIKKKAIIVILIILSACSTNRNLYRVSSISMSPNLNPGDIVKIDKSDRGFNYGDMIACYQKGLGERQDIIAPSRIVGLPGDSIQIRCEFCIINNRENKRKQTKRDAVITEYGRSFDEFEEIFPNGKEIRIFHSPDFDRPEDITEVIKIPIDHFFIMGDNRSDSYDSRHFGPIHKDKIIGKVVEVIPAE